MFQGLGVVYLRMPSPDRQFISSLRRFLKAAVIFLLFGWGLRAEETGNDQTSPAQKPSKEMKETTGEPGQHQEPQTRPKSLKAESLIGWPGNQSEGRRRTRKSIRNRW